MKEKENKKAAFKEVDDAYEAYLKKNNLVQSESTIVSIQDQKVISDATAKAAADKKKVEEAEKKYNELMKKQ